MLRFLTGRAGTDKTKAVFESIKGDLENKITDIILLVPEQFSFETERNLINALGEEKAARVSVLSFGRLYSEVSRVCGNVAGKRMTQSDSIVLMGRALNDVKSELGCLSKFWGNKDFAALCVDTVKELKTVCATPDALRQAAEKLTGRIKQKTLDLAAITESYNIKVSERFIDPCDDMDKLFEMLNNYRFFEGKTVYADGFSRFTGQQLRIIQKIIEQSGIFTVTLTCALEDDGTGVFDLPLDTKAKLEALAKEVGEKVEVLPEITRKYYENNDICALEKMLFAPEKTVDREVCNVKAMEAETVDDEADFAMYTIHKLVREKGMRFRDFAVIARNAADYEQAITRAAKKYNVACFTDMKVTADTMPLMVMVKNALQTTLAFTTQNILAYLKTGLAGMESDEICELENYVFIWNIKGANWLNEWDMNPKGLENSENGGEEADKIQKQIDRINDLRKKAVLPLLRLREAFNSRNTRKMLTAVWQLTQDCDTAQALQRLTEKLDKCGYSKEAELNRQSHSAFCRILDHLLHCMGELCEKAELIVAFSLACEGENIGSVPQTMDQVLFGGADRIRTDRPKVVFALGLNGSEWPKNLPSGGILSQNERKVLSKNGICVPGLADEFTALENYMCYMALCAPAQMLYVTYHKANGAQPSYIFEAVRDTLLLQDKLEKWPQKIRDAAQIESDKMAFAVFAENNTGKTELGAALSRHLLQNENWRDVITAAQNANSPVNGQLTRDTMEKIKQGIKENNRKTAKALEEKGKRCAYNPDEAKIPMSATASDMFNKCRFSYFCKYIARAAVPRQADLNVMQKGTIVHYVLEKLVLELKDEIKTADDAKIIQTADKHWQAYINGVKGLRESMDAKMEFMFNLLREQCRMVALRLRDEFAQSEFSPRECELKIEDGGDENCVEPVKFKSGEITLVSNGKIDRVDVDVNDEYLRIVDYKTGRKNFAPKDILVGQDLQMLLYLYNILQSGRFGKKKPAGVLYMPASLSREENNTKAMNGVLLEDEALVRKMEKENEGLFVPKLEYTKRSENEDVKQLKSNKNTFISEEDFYLIFRKITRIMKRAAESIDKGDFCVCPTDGSKDACKYCDYKAVCGIENGEHSAEENGITAMKDVLKILKEEETL